MTIIYATEHSTRPTDPSRPGSYGYVSGATPIVRDPGSDRDPPGVTNGSHGCVLIVDDEPKTLDITRDILEFGGFSVLTAPNGLAALAILQDVNVNVHAVLSDIRMPEMTGVQLLAQIRKLHGEMPVLLLTGHATVETAAQAVEHGAYEYLFKPVDFDVLKASLHRAVGRYRLVLRNRKLVRELRQTNVKLAHLNRSLEDAVRKRTRDLVLDRDLLDSAFASIPSAIAVLEADGSVGRVNNSWISLREASTAILARYEHCEAGRAEEFLCEADDLRRTYRVQAADLAGGRRLVVVDDLTERRRLEGQLVQAEKLSSLGTLATGIAHELANPVTAVLGAAELLAHRKSPSQCIDLEVQILMEAAQHMRQVCGGLSEFARRARSGETGFCQVNELCERAARFGRFSRRFRHVGLLVDTPDKSPVVRANATEMLQVILNLVTNAGHASPENEDVTIHAYVEEDRVHIDVLDRGDGVPPGIAEHIFEAFYTTKASGEGTGLGLFVGRRILERAGGELVYRPREGGGSTFRLVLPSVPPEDVEPTGSFASIQTDQ